MTSGLVQSMSLRQELAMPYGNAVSLMGLSALELEVVLDRSLGQVTAFYDSSRSAPEASRNGGNYFFGRSFSETCRSAKGFISSEKHLETPAVFVEQGEKGYSAGYNPDLGTRIAQKLALFKREKPASPEAIFSKA